MANPLGRGERRHPKNGNATLLTYDVKGNKVFTPLWINQYATDLNMQLDSAQARDGLIHRPIRMTERFLTISTIWNVDDRPKYVTLLQRLRDHWAFNLNSSRDLKPMRLVYYGANKTWLGFIENGSIGYAVTDVILSYSFNMRIIPSQATKASTIIGVPSPYVPTAQDAKTFGSQWYTTAEFLGDVIGIGNETKKGASDGTPDPITGHQGHGPHPH